MRSFPCAIVVLLLFAAGCAKTQGYQVAVRNETPEPLTAGLVKEGGPYEPHWALPEDIAVETPADDGRGWDSAVVKPGDTGSAGPVTGKFDDGSRAVLRVYSGARELDEVLAVSRGSPDRVDVPLRPGKNAIIVRRDNGKLAYERVNLASPKK
jgi:hypothetical protein